MTTPRIRRTRLRSQLWAIASLTCIAAWAPQAAAVLLDRGPDMVYDNVLDITWTRNANLAGTAMTWQQANAWAGALVLGGFDDWRLPLISVSGLNHPLNASAIFQIACGIGGPGGPQEIACRDDELAYMYWYNLQTSTGAVPQPGLNLTGDQTARGGEQIQNIQQRYWSGTAFDPNDPNSAWVLNFGGFSTPPPGGYYDLQPKAFFVTPWAVRTGDVLAVMPVAEPATLALLALGLTSLALTRRGSRKLAPPRRTLQS